MANPTLGRGAAEDAVRAVKECLDEGFKITGRPSAVREAAKRIQMQPETLRCRVRTAELTYGITVENVDCQKPPEIEFPHFPDEDIPIERIIDLQAERFEKRMASYEAHTWFPIKVNDRKPIGIVWFGDPHLDDNGANWPELKKHIAVCKSTDGVYGANIGDSTNNWAGRLVRLYAEQDTSVKTARRMAEWFMLDSGVRWMVWLLGNHDCVTPDHEVFTERGWVKFPDVLGTDRVLGFDHENGCSRWQAINEIVSFPYAGPLYSYVTSRVSIKCTPNHRFLARANRRRYPYAYTNAENLPREFTVRGAAGLADRTGVDFSDEEIRLTAWLLADGSIDRNGYVTLYQSKEAGCAEIRRLLEAGGFKYVERVRSRAISEIRGRPLVAPALDQHEFYLRAQDSRRLLKIVPQKGVMPTWCRDMNAEQFSGFFDAYVAADGGSQRHGKSGGIYGTHDFLNQLHWLCVIHGQPASLVQNNRGDWLLNYCYRDEIDVARPVTVEQYTGDVWCLRVPMSNFLVRHNGKAHFTGNSWGDGSAVLAQMAKRHGTHKLVCHNWEARFSLLFPNGWQPRIYASHDFKGNSIWNPMHGPMREGQIGEDADLYVCGHKHTAGEMGFENVSRGRYQRFLRVRGFKFMDDYARVNGYKEQSAGCSAMAIFDPGNRSTSVFMDVEEGAEFLTWKRSRA